MITFTDLSRCKFLDQIKNDNDNLFDKYCDNCLGNPKSTFFKFH